MFGELVVPQSVSLTDINTPFMYVRFPAEDHATDNGLFLGFLKV